MASSARLSLNLQRILLVCATLLAAVYASVGIAEGERGLAAGLAGLVLIGVAHRILRVPADVIVLGAVLFGYIVGNRGFAQQSLLQGLPLLPAEFALGFGLAWLVVKSSLERRFPIKRDALHVLLLLWIAVCAAHLVIDIRRYRFLAIRDFATVYYAAFFFIVQGYEGNARAQEFLRKAFLAAVAVLPVVFVAYQAAPDFFLSHFAVRGVPLIFLKGDVAVPLIATGIFLFQFDRELKHRWWAHAFALVLVLLVFASNSRAAQFAVIVVDALLVVRGSRVPWGHAGALLAAAALLILVAFSGQSRWAEDRLHTTVERVLSMGDFSGARRYESADLADKGDNNRFRLVWWRSVATETLTTNPVFGMGFGHDLARGFLQEYDPNMGESFTARSPHSILFTVLGRTGLLGCAAFFAWLIILGSRLWRASGTGAAATAHWCTAAIIFISACLGVVLEGPMGAVPFWIAVGLAYRGEPGQSRET